MNTMRVKPHADELPVSERAPHGALRAGRLYVDTRVLLPVPLEPRHLVRRARLPVTALTPRFMTA